MKRIYFFRFVAGRKRKKKLKYNLESGQVFYICMDDSVPLERGERYGETTCIIDAWPLCGLGLWVEVGGLFIRGQGQYCVVQTSSISKMDRQKMWMCQKCQENKTHVPGGTGGLK
jgi:hypothetical protein